MSRTYLQRPLVAVVPDEADVGRVDARSHEDVQVLVSDVLHLKQHAEKVRWKPKGALCESYCTLEPGLGEPGGGSYPKQLSSRKDLLADPGLNESQCVALH